MAIICWTSLHDKHGLQKEQSWSMIRLFQTAEFRSKPHLILKSQSRDKRPSKYAHLQVNLAPSENIYFLSFEFTLQSSSSPPLSPCNVSLSKPLLRQHRFRASIESFLSSIMGVFAVCCSYLACNMRAIIPAAKGAAAEVPVCLSVQPVPVPKRQSVVT